MPRLSPEALAIGGVVRRDRIPDLEVVTADSERTIGRRSRG